MRAKYRGREEPGPGRGLLAPSATLTQLKQATPSTTSSVKSSEAARPSGSCLGTWTVSQPKPPLAERAQAWQGEQRGQSPAASCGPGSGSQKMHAVLGHYPGARWEERGRRLTGRKGDRESKRRV